jgi:phenylalanine ammonia-lyase
MTIPVTTTNTFNGFTTTTHAPASHPLKVAPAVNPPVNAGTNTIGVTGPSTLLARFIDAYLKLEEHKTGKPVTIDGYKLSIADIVAVARHFTPVELDTSAETRAKVEMSMAAIDAKLASGKSVYGLSTGFGGSADTRTSHHLALGKALLQHQHAGILPSSSNAPSVLPLGDISATTTMPESWVRAAILIRINSLIRAHSGVRWDIMEAMSDLLRENVIPVVPLRGSISASGDLSPLSYIAGTLIGNPSIRVFDGPTTFHGRKMVPCLTGLANHGLKPIAFAPKEHLGLLNGTAFSAAVASLALHESMQMAMLSQVLTAMGTEALLGTQASHAPFIHDIARPHPGQVEAAKNIYDLLEGSMLATRGEEKEVKIEDDEGILRQDRYSLRTAPQFLGPQIEDLLSALNMVTQEANSTTDNPLVDGTTGHVHHGGNFQAMHVTNAMEKTRLALHHFGKILFAQSTELLNPAFNRGLPPSVAATEPSLNYHAKALDIATAAYVAELGHLANPVSTHIQSAEMHNQSVNSMALVSARATITSLDVLSLLVSSYLYILCQALDLRALHIMFTAEIAEIVLQALLTHFGDDVSSSDLDALRPIVLSAIYNSLDNTTTMDSGPRLQTAAAATAAPILDFFISRTSIPSHVLTAIPAFRAEVATRAANRL